MVGRDAGRGLGRAVQEDVVRGVRTTQRQGADADHLVYASHAVCEAAHRPRSHNQAVSRQLACKSRARSVQGGIGRAVKIFVGRRDASDFRNRSRQNQLAHSRDGGLRRKHIVTCLRGHCVPRCAVFEAHAAASHRAQRHRAACADAARSCSRAVKAQRKTADIQRHGVAVARTAGAATDGRAGGCQQTVVGFVGARDAGRGHELRGVDLFVHRRNQWLHRQAVITRQAGHRIACCAVFEAHAAASDCAKSGCATGADATRSSVCIVKGQNDAAEIKRHRIAVDCAAGAA